MFQINTKYIKYLHFKLKKTNVFAADVIMYDYEIIKKQIPLQFYLWSHKKTFLGICVLLNTLPIIMLFCKYEHNNTISFYFYILIIISKYKFLKYTLSKHT